MLYYLIDNKDNRYKSKKGFKNDNPFPGGPLTDTMKFKLHSKKPYCNKCNCQLSKKECNKDHQALFHDRKKI